MGDYEMRMAYIEGFEAGAKETIRAMSDRLQGLTEELTKLVITQRNEAELNRESEKDVSSE